MAVNSSERAATKKVAPPEACFLCLVSVMMLLVGWPLFLAGAALSVSGLVLGILAMMWIAWAMRVFWLAGSWFVAAAGCVALICALMMLTLCLVVASMR